jgi:hypothetical protein
LPHVFADCAHWWALAHHMLRALDTLHALDVIHLDVTPDNVCIPALPADDAAIAREARVGLQFARLALIDFAFSLAAAEPFASPFPASRRTEIDCRSPRLLEARAAARRGDLRPMYALDWRCDMWSLAAMLRHYLIADDAPTPATTPATTAHHGWSESRRGHALALLAAIGDAHDRDLGTVRPHQALIEACEAQLQDPDLLASLMQGFALAAVERTPAPAEPSVLLTPTEPPLTASKGAMRAPRPRARWLLPGALASVLLLSAVGAGMYLRDRAQDAPVIAKPEAPAAPSERRRADALPADVATIERSTSPEAPDSRQAQREPTPPSPSGAPRPTDRSDPPPRPVALPAPAPAAPAKPAAPADRTDVVLPSRAVEDVASRVESDAAQVLAVAASATGRGGDDRIVQRARSMPGVTGPARVPSESRTVARRLNAQARAAWERQDLDTALRLQQRAFAANPNDPEVAGNLAFFYVKATPPQPALARRLALYALGARGRQFPAGRVEDWGTLAVASALLGRESDATRAMYVMLATSRNPERACRAARMAAAQYGPAMRAPADAMLSRARARVGVAGAPSCR